MSGPSRRSLARTLESVLDFPEPRVDLEQYLTPAELAAHLVHLASLQGDLAGETVVDLGTGTGMLALAAAHYDPASVVGLDVDDDALALAAENAAVVASETPDAPTASVEWVRADIASTPLCLRDATVLSNPPFGAQRGNRHADREFLEVARNIGAVSYTIHNEGSQTFVESFAADNGGTVTHAVRAAFPIDRRFAFHTQDRAELEAEVFRIEWE